MEFQLAKLPILTPEADFSGLPPGGPNTGAGGLLNNSPQPLIYFRRKVFMHKEGLPDFYDSFFPAMALHIYDEVPEIHFTAQWLIP